MPLVQLIVLAIIQGITEFLPVSSSAHLILAPIIVNGWADQGPLIDVAGHIGSLAAVLLFFRSETATLFRGGLDTLQLKATADRRLFLMIAAAEIVACAPSLTRSMLAKTPKAAIVGMARSIEKRAASGRAHPR